MEILTKKLERQCYHIIIDVGSPMDMDSLENVLKACQNVFSLLCNTHDQSYNCLISAGLINDRYETILKPTPSFANYSKISKALLEGKMNTHLSGDDFNDCLAVGVNMAVKLLKESESKTCTEYALDLCLVTKKGDIGLKNFLNYSTSNNALVKNNTVLVLSNGDIKIEVECFIKKWLFNRKFTREHLRLLLPDDAISCDMSDNFVCPKWLHFAHNFFLHEINTQYKISLSEHECRIYKIKIITRVSSSGICNSLIFGEGYVLVPTFYRQEGFEDAHKVNKEKFYALCSALLEKEEGLIGKLEGDPPNGYFVLIPSEDSFLMKPIVSNEISFPKKDGAIVEYSNQSFQCIKDSLNLLEFKEEYDPSEYDSGIYSSLQNLASKRKPEVKEGSSDWVHPALSENFKKRSPKKRKLDPLKYMQYFSEN